MSNEDKINLLHIQIENFRSFCERETVSFSDDGKNMRKITSIIGLNATGKSNIALAMQSFKYIVKDSANAGFILPYQPFLHKTGMNTKPSIFSIEFRHGERIYTYEVRFNATNVLLEKLRERTIDTYRKRTIFERRTNGDISTGAANYGFGKGVLSRTRSDSLLITKAFEDNNKYAKIVFSALNSFYVLRCNDGELEQKATKLLQDNPSLKKLTLNALRKADFSIDDLRVDEIRLSDGAISKMNLPDFIKDDLRFKPVTILNAGHVVKKEDGEDVTDENGNKYVISNGFNNESMGTRAFIGIIVPILDAINKGKVLYIDEFGTYLHHNLVNMVIRSYLHNPSAPGLIVNTHNGMALDSVQRNSIIFTERNHVFGNTIVMTAKEKHIRGDDSFSRGYYSGRYISINNEDELLF